VHQPKKTRFGFELFPAFIEVSVLVLDRERIYLALVRSQEVKLCIVVLNYCRIDKCLIANENHTSVDSAAKVDRCEREKQVEADLKALAEAVALC
jgi:hypothetical protein